MIIQYKIVLLHFICRPGMFIQTLDKNNFISFITGYEMGSQSCHFTEPLEVYVSSKFKIQLNSGRWVGQVELLSKKLSLNWIPTFKKMALELIVEDMTPVFKTELNRTYKSRIYSLINRINPAGDPWFNDSWAQDWIALCSPKKMWFRELWSVDELKIIKAIDKKVQSDKLFADADHKFPTKELIKDKLKLSDLKIQYGV